MSPKLDLLRSVELIGLLELDLDSLQRLAMLCTSAIVQTSKQQVEHAGRTELLHKPKLAELYAAQPVKLNVGGTCFATSLETLLKESGTFFSVIFEGR